MGIQDKEKAKKLGITHFIDKPASIQKLEKFLNSIKII